MDWMGPVMCSAAAARRTGSKLRRWIGEGPYMLSAAQCSGVA